MRQGNVHYYLVGIKGTGMASLAVLLSKKGIEVGGCDTMERFSTDTLLKQSSIPVDEGFNPALLSPDCDMVIYSSAYPLGIPLLQKALQYKIPCFSYPQYLAQLSRHQDSYAVAGTHGKTTTCSVAAHLLKHATNGKFPFYALYGSQPVGNTEFPYFGDQCALFEACEYQDHFLSYQFRGVLVTSIDWDHPDYFPSVQAVVESFRKLVDKLEEGGLLVVCADDPKARELGAYATANRADLTVVEYGFAASGPFRILKGEANRFSLSGAPSCTFLPTVRSEALVNDHVGALVLSVCMLLDRPQPKLYLDDAVTVTDEVVPTLVSLLAPNLETYPGVVGRTEELFVEQGIVYLDDYAHHPREIAVSLQQLSLRYPIHKQLVIFCPHTASRTKAFLPEFINALSQADAIIIQPTYASARKDVDPSQDPARLVASGLQAKGKWVAFVEDEETCIRTAQSRLQEDWLCITMGAGNNRFLGPRIAALHRSFT